MNAEKIVKPMATRSAMASVYGLDQAALQSWLHHLTLVRNVCAHHSRLWNCEFSVSPKRPHRPAILAHQFAAGSRKLYNSLLMLLHCMDQIAPPPPVEKTAYWAPRRIHGSGNRNGVPRELAASTTLARKTGMSFPRYPKYKASGMESLGDVPEPWEVKRLRFESSGFDLFLRGSAFRLGSEGFLISLRNHSSLR